jgi:hypothetical protein
LTKGSRRVRVSARARTRVPLEKIEAIANGRVVASRDAAGAGEIALDEEITLDRSSWIALRAYGPWHRLVLNDLQTFAHTGPLYVYLDDQPIAAREDLHFYIDWIEKLIERVKTGARFASEARRQEVVDLFTKGLEEYRRREKAGVAD